MESKLPKPTSLKKPTPRTFVPSDRLVSAAPSTSQSAPKFLTVPLNFPPQFDNRTVLTQNFENVRNALGGGAVGQRNGLKRAASPEMSAGRFVRPKLRRSVSFNDLKAVVTMTTIKPTKKMGMPTNGTSLLTKPRRPNVPAPATSKPPIAAAASKPTINKPTIKVTSSATTKASATLTTAKGAAKPRIPAYDFKARFNDLNERHKTLREKYDTLTENLKEFETMPEQYEECQQKLFQTETELRNVKVQLECLQRQTSADKVKIDTLTEQLEVKTEQFRVTDEANKMLLKEKETIATEVIELREAKTELTEKNVSMEQQLREAKEIMYRFNLERKDLHNTIMDLRGNIRVFCRVRPPLDVETNRAICAWQYYDDTSLEIGE